MRFHMAVSSRARPACFSHELSLRNVQNMRRINDSVLGQVGIVIHTPPVVQLSITHCFVISTLALTSGPTFSKPSYELS